MLGGFCFSFVYLLVIKEQVAIFNEFVMRMLDKSYDVTTVWMLIRLFIQMCFQFLSGKWTVKIQNNPEDLKNSQNTSNSFFPSCLEGMESPTLSWWGFVVQIYV